jgi:asparagine synthetase B (glutamine-hydrolysing)
MKAATDGSAITLGSFVPGTNDEKYARFAGKRLQIPLQVVRARPKNLAEDVAWAMNLQDEPLGMISFFPLALMIRAARDFGKILLTGDGGDEVFLGYGKPVDWQGGQPTAASSSNPLNSFLAPRWMSDWGKRTVTEALVGHMFTKLDRASAEQGVECRSPLLDWDLLAFVRSLRPDLYFFDGRPKALLKAELQGWPTSFIDRPKIGFAYNLRWVWAASRFAGLREMISTDSIEEFSRQLPEDLRSDPARWSSRIIFRNFGAVWKLLAWSCFIERLRIAQTVSRVAEGTALPKALAVI